MFDKAGMWLLIMIFLAVALFVAVWPVRAQDYRAPHEHFHDDFYAHWRTAEGYSCCNSKSRYANGDCAPLEQSRLRFSSTGVQVWIEGEWLEVSPPKIRPYSAPDASHHLCNRGKNVLCLVVGGGS